MLKVSRLLATSLEILVANTQFSVALATSWSQFRTLTSQQVFNNTADRYLQTIQPSTRKEHNEFKYYLQEIGETLIVSEDQEV